MRLLPFLLCLFLATHAGGQGSDSIRYANGYLHFHQYGTGRPVIILTGGPGASHLQLEQVARHVGKTHRAILLEQRGTGRSIPTPYDSSTVNIQAARADLLRLLDHLQLKEAHFLGHSWGAMLAMNFAAHHPGRVTSLVLIGSGPFKFDPHLFNIYSANREARLSAADQKERAAVFQKMKAANPSAADQEQYYKWELIPVLFNRAMVDSLMSLINKGGLNPRTGGLLMSSLAREGADLSKTLQPLGKPVHIIAGSQDPGGFISYELKIAVPAAHLHWINQAGHFPMYEQPAKFYEVLDGALR